MSRPTLLYVIFTVQILCAVFFSWDVLVSVLGLSPLSWRLHEVIEIGAIVGLVLGVAISVYVMREMHRRTARIEDQLRVASGAFMELVDEKFSTWDLTSAERDVALFSIKGMSTAEIAGLRETSEGTVKAQTNAIYRKAGVSGRSQLLSLFIEDLMDGPVMASPSERSA
ncbi:helix-turn-helix transcriptional regulator [Pseudooctadecabacter sp.]|uniref:helix-turn-helix transcriptional regulator n=1 Tax=Pseudooctadecabacter sp. TaxID=1966338 RepID=UPI0035C8693A